MRGAWEWYRDIVSGFLALLFFVGATASARDAFGVGAVLWSISVGLPWAFAGRTGRVVLPLSERRWEAAAALRGRFSAGASALAVALFILGAMAIAEDLGGAYLFTPAGLLLVALTGALITIVCWWPLFTDKHGPFVPQRTSHAIAAPAKRRDARGASVLEQVLGEKVVLSSRPAALEEEVTCPFCAKIFKKRIEFEAHVGTH